MNKRGQAALEYLMTYGWALIVIAIVVGVLLFVAVTPTGGVVCSSSDPTKMMMARYNVASSGTREIVLQNATGGTITAGALTVSTMTGATMAPTTIGTTVPGGASIAITSFCSVANTCKAGTTFNKSASLAYTDQFGYAKTVTVTCQGTTK